MPRPRRIAVLDHVSAGGVSRFVLALVTHLARQHPSDLQIDYYVAAGNIKRDHLDTELASLENVRLVPIPGALDGVVFSDADAVAVTTRQRVFGALRRSRLLYEALSPAYRWFRSSVLGAKQWYHYALDAEVEQALRGYDLIYMAWPYFIEPVDFGVPLVGTFHDFHFRRFPKTYSRDQYAVADRETRDWLSRSDLAIVSAQFIREQVLEYYGDVAPAVEVVPLAPYGFVRPDSEAIEEVLVRLGVRRPYILYSGSCSEHKNIAGIARAVGILKEQGTPVQLVITGHGTEVLGNAHTLPPSDPARLFDAAANQSGLVRGDDYLPLGYVTNEEVDALAAGANAVVSASLYEAGCGPAMDAWQAGVPVAFSDIPPFVEQLTLRGVEAWVFDPRDPQDIAEKLKGAVFDLDVSHAMAQRSKSAFERYSWDDVAEGYYRVFCEAVANPRRRRLS